VTLHYMNTTLTGLFTLECVMKIFSFGFRVRRERQTDRERVSSLATYVSICVCVMSFCRIDVLVVLFFVLSRPCSLRNSLAAIDQVRRRMSGSIV